MNTFTPPCEIYPDEDFNFICEVVENDDEEYALALEISCNEMCHLCPWLQGCMIEIRQKIADTYEANIHQVVDQSPQYKSN